MASKVEKRGVPDARKIVKLVWQSSEEDPQDFIQFFTVILSMTGIMFKRRFLCLQALLVAIVALSNSRISQLKDPKHILTILAVSLLSLIMAYIGPASAQFQ